jgi:hypothetical protein
VCGRSWISSTFCFGFAGKAISPNFRKDGFTKIFRIPLNAKQQKQMEALDLHIPGLRASLAFSTAFVCSLSVDLV